MKSIAKFGLFYKRVTGAISNLGLRSVDVAKKTRGAVDTSMMSLIMNGHAIPKDSNSIEKLAKALSLDPKELRTFAAADRAELICDNYGVKMKDICHNLETLSSTHIPLFPSTDLSSILSPEGRLLQQSDYTIEVHGAFANYFAIQMEDQSLYPQVKHGNVCVIAAGKKALADELGVVHTKKEILFGVVKFQRTLVSVVHFLPFNSTTVEQKSIRFAYPVAAVFLKDHITPTLRKN